MSKGAIARAEALAAGHPKWWEVTTWPEDEKKTYTPDPKIKTPKKPKKGGKKK